LLKDKQISEFEHNKIDVKKFLEEWDSISKESIIPIINIETINEFNL
jgi:hypothetical protein